MDGPRCILAPFRSSFTLWQSYARTPASMTVRPWRAVVTGLLVFDVISRSPRHDRAGIDSVKDLARHTLRSGWVWGRGPVAWELPCGSEATASSSSEVGPHTTHDERLVPREWVEGIARFEQHRSSHDVARHRWRQFVDDCNAFLNWPEADRMAQLAWDALALFGCRALPGSKATSRATDAIRSIEIVTSLHSHWSSARKDWCSTGASSFKIRQLFSPAVISCRLKTKSPSKGHKSHA
jgi:hypothetical protein